MSLFWNNCSCSCANVTLVTDGRIRVEAPAVWGVMMLVMVPTVAVFWQRRESPNIKNRSPLLMLFVGIGMIGVITIELWGLFLRRAKYPGFLMYGLEGNLVTWGQPCILDLINHYFFWNLWMIGYPLRAVRLVHRFRLGRFAVRSSEVNVHSQETADSLAKTSSRLRSWKLFSGQMIWAISIAVLSIGIRLVTHNTLPCYDCDATQGLFSMVFLFYGVALVFQIVTLVLLRKEVDEYGINNELRAVVVVWLVILIPWATIGMVISYKRNMSNMNDLNWMPIACTFLSFCISFIMPLGREFLWARGILVPVPQRSPSPSSSADQTGKTLESCLLSPIGLRHLRRFLVTEFSAENLLFLEQARALLNAIEGKKESEEGLLRQTATLLDSFLLEGSLMEVNISSRTRKALCGSFESKEVDAIAHDLGMACDEVMFTLRTDSFPRFQASNIYVEMRYELTASPSMSFAGDPLSQSSAASQQLTEVVSISSGTRSKNDK